MCRYGQECDIWSLGVIMYVLLCGYAPFHGTSDADLLDKIHNQDVEFERSDWDGVRRPRG